MTFFFTFKQVGKAVADFVGWCFTHLMCWRWHTMYFVLARDFFFSILSYASIFYSAFSLTQGYIKISDSYTLGREKPINGFALSNSRKPSIKGVHFSYAIYFSIPTCQIKYCSTNL